MVESRDASTSIVYHVAVFMQHSVMHKYQDRLA
jgi:hypothetical protein